MCVVGIHPELKASCQSAREHSKSNLISYPFPEVLLVVMTFHKPTWDTSNTFKHQFQELFVKMNQDK